MAQWATTNDRYGWWWPMGEARRWEDNRAAGYCMYFAPHLFYFALGLPLPNKNSIKLYMHGNVAHHEFQKNWVRSTALLSRSRCMREAAEQAEKERRKRWAGLSRSSWSVRP